MIVDASLVIDAVADHGPRGRAARGALAGLPAAEPLTAPGHFAIEVMSGLNAAAQRPGHPLAPASVPQALAEAAAYEIVIQGTPWDDVQRAWSLARTSMRYADALYVAAAERMRTAVMTTDTRIERSGAPITCDIITVSPGR